MKKVEILSTVLIVFGVAMLISSSNCFAADYYFRVKESMPQYSNGTPEIMQLLLNRHGGSSPAGSTTYYGSGSTVTKVTNPSTGESTVYGGSGGSTSQYVPTTTTQGKFYPQIPPNVSNQTITVHMNMIGTSGKYEFHGHPGEIVTTPQGQFRLPYTIWDQEYRIPLAQFTDTDYDGVYDTRVVYNYPETSEE